MIPGGTPWQQDEAEGSVPLSPIQGERRQVKGWLLVVVRPGNAEVGTWLSPTFQDKEEDGT